MRGKIRAIFLCSGGVSLVRSTLGRKVVLCSNMLQSELQTSSLTSVQRGALSYPVVNGPHTPSSPLSGVPHTAWGPVSD